MEPGHGSELKTHPNTGEVDQFDTVLTDSESFTSSSSSDNFEDTFELNGNESIKVGTDSPTEVDDGLVLPATPSPPDHQEMQRPAESTYRIPDSVFETSKSTQMDWSTASAESLFSIHAGENTSFNTDSVFLVGKSGDLGENKSPEPARKSCNISVSPTEAAAAQTMKEVIMENEERRSKETQTCANSLQHSDSAKSFAFDSGLAKEGGHSAGKQKSPPVTPKSETQMPKKDEMHKQQNPETNEETQKHHSPKTKEEMHKHHNHKKWLSWCPFSREKIKGWIFGRPGHRA